MVEQGIIVGVIIGLNQVVKKYINKRYIPIMNIIFGIIGSLALAQTGNTNLDIFNGIIMGLTAAGVYSSTKTVTKI